MFYWVAVGCVEGKVRAASSRSVHLRPGTEDVLQSYFVFSCYLFIYPPDHNVPPSRGLMRHYVNTPNTPLHRVLHSPTYPYTYKYNSLDHLV